MNKNKLTKIIAYIGLVVIALIIVAMLYALITKNGQLALTMIFALTFVSILFFIGIKLYKGLADYNKNELNEK